MAPFEDDDVDIGGPNKAGTDATAFFSKKSNKAKDDFEKRADEANNRINSYKERAADLASSFKKILDDKTLPSNKTIFAADLEKEVISKLVQLAIDMNTDENELEGMGSVGLITLLLRSSLIQRDRVNSLEYRCVLLEKKINEMESSAKKSG